MSLQEYVKTPGLDPVMCGAAYEKLRNTPAPPKKRKLRSLLWVMLVWPIFVVYVSWRKIND